MNYGRATVLLSLPTGTEQVRVLVARTPAEHMQGLKGVLFLPSDSGMLFEFEISSRVGPHMTMAGVSVPLDMVFVDRRERVLQVLAAVPGQSVVVGPVGTRYVVELAAGRAQGLRPGSMVRVRS